MMEALGLKPGQRWTAAAALSELGRGVLTAFGLFNPLGPLGIMGSMSMATATVHWGKPIWVTAGGAELRVTNMAIADALTAAGPGRYSLDHAFGIRLPGVIVAGTLIAAAALLGLGLAGRCAGAPGRQEQAGAQAPAGQEATAS
jgi:putative oxidoreductase